MKVFKFEVDEDFARRNNEMLRDTRRFRTSGISLGIILVVAAVIAFFATGRAPWTIWLVVAAAILAIAFIATGIAVARKFNSAQDIYDRYPLVPAVIAEVNERDMVLMALVNASRDPEDDAPALCLRTVTKIPGVDKPTKGTKVPCCAVYGHGTSQDTLWHEVRPMPIAWGTPDQEVVAIARKSIPQDQWNNLDRHRDKLDLVKNTPQDLYVL